LTAKNKAERGVEMGGYINNVEEVLLQKMVDTIVNEVAPETIILFGSRARGDAGVDSDVDLIVVETEPFSPQRSRRKETARLYMALRDLGVSKDILLYSRDEFEHWKTSLNHVVGRAHREGRVSHGRC
jgi:predicted nucleotidyltransferase